MTKEIDRKTRKLIGTLIEWYLTGELEDRIEIEKIKAEEDPAPRGANYSGVASGSGGGGGSITEIEGFEIKISRAEYRMKKLKSLKKMMDAAYRLIDKEYKVILEMYYKEGYTIKQISVKLGYSKRSVKRKKRSILDNLARHLDIKNCKII
ncbi:sigma factor-like helix-turn-helix DNA-binding protein [Fuchsiella alkaliacetigena]|uniref:sigma factor-like helix-turn-helix DNA-binding protein n=1 Tax=Fuchsiella alkaliacetigena TaxID=957042 RepID=UPI00200A3AAB|nr:hypothetical protein [Fuchsiella alkaliacetigena]MCK8824717.1 hypothetical protein [Fuchsiella alkaliacetigena]